MRGLEEMGKAASLTQESAEEVDAKTFAQNPTAKKRSLGVVPSFWEQARRSQADAESQKRADPALKSPLKSPLKSIKSANFNKSPLVTKEFPFPRRPRTFRSSDPPRRFDDPRKD
ncbi:MAG: hypothetical protein IKK39_02530 [Thermoguttaceae bacterium]|nr:hypothetical protein [Thermoguttaceae bacterium]